MLSITSGIMIIPDPDTYSIGLIDYHILKYSTSSYFNRISSFRLTVLGKIVVGKGLVEA